MTNQETKPAMVGAQEPVAWQARFTNEAWRLCAKEHHELVEKTPIEWRGYETRALYAAPVAQQPRIELAATRTARVYLAGPMTGIPEFNFPAFHAEAARLRSDGFHVENPAEHGIVSGAEWGDYLRYDLGRLSTCERIHLLPGWSNSKGAKLEVLIAKALGFAITYADEAEVAQQPQAKDEPSNCTQCSNADSWGTPDKPVCLSCKAGSEWEPLNKSSVNPNKQPQARPDFADEWTGYLKDGETPFERFLRERKDLGALTKLYQRALEENERLKARQHQEIEVQCPVCSHKFHEWPNDKQPQADAVPNVCASFYTESAELIGTTEAPIKRVEREDDGTLHVYIDYWPQQAEAVPSLSPICLELSAEPGCRYKGLCVNCAAPQQAEAVPPTHVPDAVKVVLEAMRSDPGYAWSWHCNIAMAFVDAGGDPYTANQGAARFMKLLANVEPAHELPAAPEQQPEDHLKLHAVEELCQLGYTVKDGELFPPDHLHKLMEAAGHPLAAAKKEAGHE